MADEFEDDKLDDLDDNFDDFDTGGGTSLKDLWTNNPLVKIGLVIAGLGIVIGGLFVISGGGSNKNASNIAEAPDIREIADPNSPVTPAYEEAINQEDARRREEAARKGGSTLPSFITKGDESRRLDNLNEPEEVENDVFDQWRIQEFNEKVSEKKQEIKRDQDEFVQQFDNAVSNQPDPQAVADLSDAMLAQMRAILEAQQLPPTNIITVTQLLDNQNLDENNIFGNRDTSTANQQNVINQTAPVTPIDQPPVKVLVSAGTIAYSQLMTEANSDIPGPLLGQIVDGRFAGARIIGEFETAERHLTIKFNRLTFKNKSYSISAVAIDPNTNLSGMATDYDARYFKRVVLPAAAKFVEGIGRAVARSSSTSVSTVGGTTSATEEDLDIEQEVGAGFEEAAREVGDIFDEEASRTEPLIRVRAGTPMALVFLEDVQEDGQTPQNEFTAQQQNALGASTIQQGFNPYQQGYNPQAGFQNNGFGAQQPLSTQEVNQFLNQP